MNGNAHSNGDNGKCQYKLIVLDLDGTLTNSKKEVTAATREALSEAMTKGVIVVLASGRPTYGVAPIADLLQLDKRGGYILSFNGGSITNWKTKEVIYSKTLR